MTHSRESADPKKRRSPWPSDIPMRDWLSILSGVARGMRRNRMSTDASAISFLALFAIFSAMSAFVAFYGLIANPALVVTDMRALTAFAPADAVISMINQMKQITTRSTSTLWGAGIFSAVVAIWCAQQGIATLMAALNAVYAESKTMSGWRHLVWSSFLAVAVIGGLLLVSLLVIGLPVTIQVLGYSLLVSELARAVGMVLGGLVLFFGLTALYRWVPNRDEPPRWRWVRVGSGVVVLFWAVASILFSIFLSYSDSYTAMYGSLSGVVLLLTLTYVTVITMLVGAEFSAQLEAQATPGQAPG